VPRSSYRRVSVPLRAALLMPLAAMTVHQLRYYVIFGAHAPAHLARDGHGYLSFLEPLVLLAAAIAAGGLAGRCVRAWSGESPRVRRERHAAGPFASTWLLCTGVLIGLYCAQELAEGMLAVGHAAGVAGIIGHGGLIAAPLAAILGGALTLALRSAERLLDLVARDGRGRNAARAAAALPPLHRPRALRDWRLAPASGLIAGRAPPFARASQI
jgi:hypothetical protein